MDVVHGERWTFEDRFKLAAYWDGEMYRAQRALEVAASVFAEEVQEKRLKECKEIRDWLLGHRESTRRVLRVEALRLSRDEALNSVFRQNLRITSGLLDERTGSIRMGFIELAKEVHGKLAQGELDKYIRIFGWNKAPTWRQVEKLRKNQREKQGILHLKIDGCFISS